MEDFKLIDDFRQALQEDVLEVTFTKKDGSERIMRCTTRSDLVAETASENTPDKLNKDPDLFRVTDVDIGEWRSFRWDQVVSVSRLVD